MAASPRSAHRLPSRHATALARLPLWAPLKPAGLSLLAAAAFGALVPAPTFADGNDTLGPVRPGFPIATANRLFAAGAGVEFRQPGTITLTIPEGNEIRQVLLYWGLRSTQPDPEVTLNGSIAVRGEQIGTSPTWGADTRPYVLRADITSLGLVRNGTNEITVEGLTLTESGMVNGAELVVLADDGGGGSLAILDGCDAAFWRFDGILQTTVRQKFTFPPASFARQANLLLVVGDHTRGDKETDRPSTLEIQVPPNPLIAMTRILRGSDGPSWDTISVPVEIPAESTLLETQFFSDNRVASKLSASSFYWLFAALQVPEDLSVSGIVYCDMDGDGTRDEGDEGLPGAELSAVITLGDQMDKRTVIADDGGAYRVDGIPPGAGVRITVVPTAALKGKEPTEACPPIEAIASDVTDCDFGFAPPPIVGDTVFLDANGDGAQQAGEPGLAGVAVTIQVPGGFTDDAVTDASGKYLFMIPGVAAGTTVVATVRIDPETGDAQGKTLTTPNPQDTIALGLGGVDLARDFGLRVIAGNAQVGDTVFLDADGNGRQDAGETGLRDVKVMLVCPESEGFPGSTQMAGTDPQGKYLFVVPGIPAGRTVICTVSIDPESGEAAGKDLTTPNPQETAPLGPEGADLDRDFGLEPRIGDALVGDTVFCDLDGDGVQDAGEPGIQGVPVRLSAAAAGGFPGSNQNTTTDAGGKYVFTVSGIPFSATIVAQVSIDATSPLLAAKVLTTPNPQDTAPLGPGTEDRDRDFGLKPLAARVGDTVFLDADGDGMQDAGEEGLSGVLVRIESPAAGAFGGYSDTATTDTNGKYLFNIEGIPPANTVIARVEIDTGTGEAAGKVLTTPNPQLTIALGAGAEDLNRDFGLRLEEITVKTCLEEKTARSGESVDVRVLLSSSEDIQGFETAVSHDPAAVTLELITIAGTVTEANHPDFTSFEVLPAGGTAAVVMDLEAPFEGNTIPAGTSLPILVFRYACRPVAPGGTPETTPLRFVSGELGSPPKENTVVINGLPVAPELCHGSITCLPGEDFLGPCFLCGGPSLGPDNIPVPIQGAPGERVELCFYYCSPEDNEPGHPQFDHLQGLSMAICIDCNLECLEGTFRVGPDTITSALEVEFVNFDCENDPNDGDGCEMVLGILVDALSPFDGQTLPPTDVPLKLACVDLRISPEATCGQCLPVEFCDGADATGNVPIKNLFAAENQSFPARTVDCAVCVLAAPLFRRGDCNADGKANLPDAAAMVSSLFGMPAFDPPCLDGCDSNDDGRLDIADAVSILFWLFRDGTDPPAPGPVNLGADPTADKLPCDTVPCPE